jgi:benzoyl-CoA reductase/2-hydroxyglutaryl-CoA dehydratase subunit BcrC/BadD/HgdB
MNKREFYKELSALFNKTLEEGPGPRAVAQMTAEVLTFYIFNEAGCHAPEAVSEVAHIMEDAVEAIKARDPVYQARYREWCAQTDEDERRMKEIN